MNSLFSDRILNTNSPIGEIFKLSQKKGIISFAGGLPNPDLFPLDAISKISELTFSKYKKDTLQYSNTEGFHPLRELLANSYNKKWNKNITAENILITSGAQQGMDLIGKVFLNKQDNVILEAPAYLGTIQLLSLLEAQIDSIHLEDDGLNIELFEQRLNAKRTKLISLSPNFQNPSGCNYSNEKRKKIAEILSNRNIILVEDDAYGELRYSGAEIPPICNYLENGILLRSFSKTLAPGFRVGMIYGPKDYIKKLNIAKQISDLHTNILAQLIIYEYLSTSDYELQIKNMRNVYRKKKDFMLLTMKNHFPQEISYTNPSGGMYIWAKLPKNLSSKELLNISLKKNVAFVPGDHFFVDNEEGKNCLRLNFTNLNDDDIELGIKKLGESIKQLLANQR